MNKHLHLALGFVTGVAVGASVMSLYLNRKHSEKLDILQEEWLKPIDSPEGFALEEALKEFADIETPTVTSQEESAYNDEWEEVVKIVNENYVSMVNSPVRDASKEINNKHIPVDYTTFVEEQPAEEDIGVEEGQLSVSVQDDGSFVFKEHRKEDVEMVDIYDEEVENPKIEGKSGIEVIHDEDMYGDDDYTYYEKITLTYYDEDHTLTDETDVPIRHMYKLVGDSLDSFEYQAVIYVRNHDLETDFEIVRVENSYSKLVLGIDQ